MLASSIYTTQAYLGIILINMGTCTPYKLNFLSVGNMAKSKEWCLKFRQEVIALHKQGNGYKKIAKLLHVSRNTIGSIVRKFKDKGTVATQVGRGRKKK